MDYQQRKRLRQSVMAGGYPDPTLAFARQRANAKKRGVSWDLTFYQWWLVWENYYHLRGRGTNGVVMARKNDEGPYALGNIYLTTNLGNLQDHHNNERTKGNRDAKRLAREIKPVLWGRKSCGINHFPSWHNRNMQETEEID